MKYLIIILISFLCGPVFSQDGLLPIDSNKNVVYSDVGTLKSTKEEIYEKAQKWATNTLGNYENLASQEETLARKLVMNSYIPLSHSLYDYVRFNITIECEDEKYKVKIDDLDGTSPVRTPVRFGSKENDVVTEKAMLLKTETNRKRRSEAQQNWQNTKADNEGINNAVFRLLASLKEYMASGNER